MKLYRGHNGDLRAISPFIVGETEVLLVPNKLDGSEPSVLLIARCRSHTVSNQLAIADMRQFAAYLQAAADEAEALTSPHTGRGPASKRGDRRFA